VQQSVMSLQDLVIGFLIYLFIGLFFNLKSCRNPCVEGSLFGIVLAVFLF